MPFHSCSLFFLRHLVSCIFGVMHFCVTLFCVNFCPVSSERHLFRT